ncbi:MAG: zinc ABC transporter substrate-binding protein [Clostridia bacterium]|nr:zinc ABC transporter substrate-binding protein [Clostridia bacterium]
MKKIISLILACAVLLVLGGCRADRSNGKPNVSVAIVPMAEMASAVAGDLWNVNVVIPAGSSPENYEPTVAERMALEDSSIYFSVGVPAEAAAILPIISSSTKIVHLDHAVAEQYADLKMAEGRDPHIWLSPKRAEVMVAAMAESFALADPANKEIYMSNAQEYIAKINSADEYIKQKFEGVVGRKFIAFNPAFAYFADEYGLRMVALQEEGREATLQHMQDMADYAKREGIKAVVYQGEIDSKQVEAFAQQIGGTTMKLEPLAPDYIENLKEMADILAEIMK